ncbi:hypothetical protein ABL840_21655 [Variovorax sp. NFACC27]|uniref:Uncharacterized protein n=1 Tax=Variovorax gossypii TaxID=1679495 RepID=A0A431TR80_9BURK|nr:hypothetical protein [Variovorax gossypii]MDP9601083.1 hypothetical protein [Variovorax paradoxus]SEF32571.1 hypothetical protein SAMN03159371_06008 [Variovorax sp. NFACC28]SEG94636.1 hypothetical protein SAMN03159365_06086 [Variovorax sp. NFACC29]SFD71404.1 hypothetical protein SAMN03159379_06045 [Variovorax sp. NFACC26]SFG85073.1 hypothetical protein SAMN03159447_05205 [Variovorax sp. NFACC27]
MTRTVLLLWLAACCATTAAAAASVAQPTLRVERMNMGSGLQNARGTENAEAVGSLGVWHVPQYMPGYPTAATIWPRVIVIQCTNDLCAGYEVTPEMGRGEYLFFVPAGK